MMKRIREELPILSNEYDEVNTTNDAEWEDSDLELGFRFLEEIEEEAEKKRFASLDEAKTTNDAEWGESDLELGFRFLEEIEEKAEKERFASLDEGDWDTPLGSLDTLDAYSSEELNTFPPRVRVQSVEKGIVQAAPTAFSAPITPKSTPLIPSSQQPSDPRPLPVTYKPARQRVINADRSPTNNDFKSIKKRKRGASPGNLDCSILNVDAQSIYRPSLKDIQSIPSTPRRHGKSVRPQAANGLLTPSSLDHSSPRAALASPSVDYWYPNMSQSSGKPSENLEIATPKDVEEMYSDCTELPNSDLMPNQNLLTKIILSDQVGLPVQSSSLPISSRIRLPYDVSSRHDDIGHERVQRETKKMKFDQQVSPLMGRSIQSSASIEGSAGLQSPISAARVASRTSPQTGCVQFGVSRGTSRFSPILIDLDESEEDDPQLSVDKTSRSLSHSIPKQMPKLADSFDKNSVRVKPSCDETIPNFEQDSSHTQHGVVTTGVTDNKNPISGSILASDGVLAGSSSMKCVLQNYIGLRKGNNPKPERTTSHYFPVIKPLVVDDRSKENRTETCRPIENVKSHISIPSMTKPQYIIPAGHRYFVVSTSFLRNRKLACGVQRLYPEAEFIERDFALHEPSASPFQNHRGPALLSTDKSPDEADITISPGVGIMLTTLQKIRQCSLPGQAIRFVVRERVARVAPRYEKLLILVSKDSVADYLINEGGSVVPHEVDSDYEAMTDFIGFCSSLTYDTQATFMDGREEQLADWIVAMMAKHSEIDLGIKLISEETTGELFLRRAGFNSFAAQAILGESIEQITAAGVSTAGNAGLSAFLKMSVEKRVKRFQKMFGGSELLKRVSSQLEARR